MKKLVLVLGAFIIYSCQSAPVLAPKAETPAAKKPLVLSSPSTTYQENVDYAGLQDNLKLNRNFDQLGYSEKAFNTCEAGFGYSSTHNCRRKTFVVIHFQLMCRDSEGTISQVLTQNDLRPISRQNIKWTLKNAAGKLLTDSEGYGQIAMVSTDSQRYQRLKLSVDNDFLYLKAGELTQMITPKSWCN